MKVRYAKKTEKEIKRILEDLYPSTNKPLRRLLNKWTAKDFSFSISILGNGMSIKLLNMVKW